MKRRMQRSPSSGRWLGGSAAAVLLVAFAACADQPVTGPGPEPEVLFSHGDPEVQAGEVEVCKHVEAGNGEAFDFTASTDGPAGELLESSFTLSDGECVVVWRSGGPLGVPADPRRNVTITELVPAGWQVDLIEADVDPEPFDATGTNEVTVAVNTFHGATVVFHNSRVVVGTEGCTPGYWRNTRLEWPIDQGTLFSDAFGVGPDTPLSETVKAKGGGANALQRHATAGLLNALSSVEYPYTSAQVIEQVQDAYATGDYEAAKDVLEAANELGCPLSNR